MTLQLLVAAVPWQCCELCPAVAPLSLTLLWSQPHEWEHWDPQTDTTALEGSNRQPRDWRENDLEVRKAQSCACIYTEPLPSHGLEWHYAARGLKMAPYEYGNCHWQFIFPRGFPFKPPHIYTIAPSGRFSCNRREWLSIQCLKLM